MALDSTLKRRDSLMPQPPGGLRKGTMLALLVHVGLLIALAFGVAWRSRTPAGVSAELWAPTPQVAAPPVVVPKPTPVPPPPPPTVKAEEPPPKPAQADAQIAIEKEKAERIQREQREQREQQERDRKERERVERDKADKAEKVAAQKQRELEAKQQKEEAARQAKQREDNLKRIMGEAGTGSPNSPGAAARDAGPSASYAGRIIGSVKPNIMLTDDLPGNPQADVEVRCAPDGTIVGSRLVRSSGNKVWDDAVLRALERTGKLPRDTDGRVPSPMVLAFSLRD